MSNFLIAIAVFVITVIGALFAVPHFIDWNGYRGVFEEEATRLLGREVRVGGAVNLNLLPTPYFRFEKVRIADTSANLQEPFFRADSLTVKLSVPPLLKGVVEANEIEFQRPILRLAPNEKDGWNWQSFSQTFSNAAYLPSNVALTSVRITDGVLAVHAADGLERTRLEGVNGELSAPALDGPYRFRGTYGKGGVERELRIGTARAEADGSVRFKAILRVGSAGNTYTLDARLVDLLGRPRIEGDLTARLPIAGLWQTSPRTAAVAPKKEGVADEEARSRAEAAFDLKATVTADAAGASLADLALSFEQDGQPQLATGELKAAWRTALAVDLSLSSRWLDLDRVAGAAEGAGPLDSAIPLAVRLRDLLPAEGRSRATFVVDQANIGGEAVSGLRVALARTNDKLDVEELRMGMPGGSRGELQGVVSGPSDAPVFQGSLGVRGTSLVRFLTWVTGNGLTVDAKGDGAFGIRSQLSIAPGRAAAQDLVGDLSGTAIYGTAQYAWEGRPALSLQLESPQLDARAFMPAGASLGDLLDLLLHGPSSAQAAGPGLAGGRTGWRGAQTDAAIRFNAGQLITAARSYRDVALEMELKGGRLSLPLLRIASDDGFSLELEGMVDDAAARPKGAVHALISAETGQAIAPLAELLGVPEALRLSDRRAEALTPLRMAGSLSFGLRTPTSADLSLDGEANAARVKLNARFDGGTRGWRTGPADVTALIESGNAGIIAALVAPAASPARADNAGPGRLLLKASGVPSEGLASIASVETGELALNFRGQLITADGGNKIAGDLEIRAADGARIAALAGLAPPLRLDGVPIAGTLKLSATGGGIGIERLSLKIGASDVRGQIALSQAGERRRIEARLDTDEITFARLLAPLLDQRMAVTGTAEAAISGRQSLWPDEPFDAAVLGGFEGTIRLNSKRLTLADGIGLKDARLDIALEDGKIDVKQIEGTGLGGRCSGSLRIERIPAGAAVSGRMRVEDGALDALAAASSGRAATSGTLAGEITFSGRGTSPRNVVSALQGTGSLAFSDAKLAALWPGAVGKAMEAALKADPDRLASTLREALAAGLSAGQLALPATVALEIADGQLRAKALAIDAAEGRASGSASLDLKTLGFESDWRLEHKPPTATDKAALPAVSVSYRGPVAALATLEPRVASDALERELSVRKMERDLEELERLRKLDEARRRTETERLRRQFEPPPAPVPVAPAQPQTRPAAPG